MVVAPACPLFKSLLSLIHVTFGRVSLLHTHTHTLIVLPFGSLSYSLAGQYRRINCTFFFQIDSELEICFNRMKRCTAEGHGSAVIVNREVILQSCHNAEVSSSKTLNSHQRCDGSTADLTYARPAGCSI